MIDEKDSSMNHQNIEYSNNNSEFVRSNELEYANSNPNIENQILKNENFPDQSEKKSKNKHRHKQHKHKKLKHRKNKLKLENNQLLSKIEKLFKDFLEIKIIQKLSVN